MAEDTIATVSVTNDTVNCKREDGAMMEGGVADQNRWKCSSIERENARDGAWETYYSCDRPERSTRSVARAERLQLLRRRVVRGLRAANMAT